MNRDTLLPHDIAQLILSKSARARTDLLPTDRLVEDLGIDSLGILEILVELERWLGVELHDDDLTGSDLGTIAKVAELIERHLHTPED